MSSSDRKRTSLHSRRKLCTGLVIAIGMLATSSCTVSPLYGNRGIDGSSDMASMLASVEVKPVATRYALEVRNHLIFLLGGGQGQPANSGYQLDIGVTRLVEGAASVQIVSDNEPTAGVVRLTSNYTLIETATGEAVASGKRVASASFDHPRQEFAELRAERDAENRAARELAEILRLAIAQDLRKNKR